MTAADLREVVRIHASAFPGFFLTNLGPRFLTLFYAESIHSGAIALTAVTSGRVIGFASGSEDPRGFYRRILSRRLLAFSLAILPSVARRPILIGRVARALSIAGSAHATGEATLMSVAVDPSWRNRGIGTELVATFLGAARARGAVSVNLLTERDENDATKLFYQGIGFRVVREIYGDHGPTMNEYEIELHQR